MQTTAPTESAIGEYHSPVQPSATKIVHVRMSVAMVMPETGFDDDPIRPTMREETVTKKNPKTITSTEATKLPWVGRPGATARKKASSHCAGQHDGHRDVPLRPCASPSGIFRGRSPSCFRGTTR